MKVIMLDIDGVLNDINTTTKHRGADGRLYDGVDAEKIVILKRIIDITGAMIVLSSSWRNHPESCEYLYKELGEELTSKIIDHTPYFRQMQRADEIESWLSKHLDVTKFVVLDDCDDDLERFGRSFVETKMSYGLTEELAAKCIDLLQ